MMRNTIKVLSILVSLALVVFGAHGLYAYFYPLEIIFKSSRKLFGELNLPDQLGKYIEWMSNKGVQSWFIPALVILAGVLLFYWQTRWVWRPLRRIK
jgi:hypothetical protein